MSGGRTTLISIWCAAFLAGLALVKIVVVSSGATLFIVGLLLLFLCIKHWWLLAVPAVIASGLLIGVWRGSLTAQALDLYKPYLSHKVTLQAVASEDTTFNTKHQLDVRADEVVIGGQKLPGVVRVTTFDPVEPRRGDTIQVTGKLLDGFGNYQAAVYYAKVTIIHSSTSFIEQIRREFSANILSILPEPQADLGLGFLIGLKSQLPDSLNKQLQALSLTHIVVASGYNLTILIRLSRRLFARRSKYQAMLGSVLLMFGFLLVTGFSASMSRAALVTGLSLAAWYYGRKIHPVLLLLFSAAITAAISPAYIWSDLGWWLSFLAFAGVMLGAPLAQRRIFGEKPTPVLIQIAIETVCAQLATMPLIMFTFGTFSILALPANLLIVPFTPLAMLLTFIPGVAAWITPNLAAWLAVPALWLLSYMTQLIGWLSHISWAAVPVTLSIASMISLYLLLIGIGLLLQRKTQLDYLDTNVTE